MEYITHDQHYPGALSTDAVSLLSEINGHTVWTPDYHRMSRARIAGLAQLIRAGYVYSCAWWGYRVNGSDALVDIRTQLNSRNKRAYAVDLVKYGSDHQVRRIQVVNEAGQIEETVIYGDESLPAIKALFATRRALGVDGFEDAS